MNKIQEIIDKVYECKQKSVKNQEYQHAADWRDLERNLIRVNQGESLRLFLEQFKRTGYENFEVMYEVIKPLDVASLRNEKLSKIEKLYNKI